MKLKVLAVATSALFAGFAPSLAEASGDRMIMRELRAQIAPVLNELRAAEASPADFTAPDQGFTAITPCRAADTRDASGGRLGENETRNFQISGDLTSQGGSAEGCPVPDDATAVAVNVTVVRPSAASPTLGGFAAIFPGGTEWDGTSLVNYVVDDIIANATIVGLGDGLDVRTRRETDIILDVTGYFRADGLTLDCFTTLNDPVLVDNGDFLLDFAICPEDYAVVGGGCDQNSFMQLSATGTFTDIESHICVFDNFTGEDAGAATDALCCRIGSRAPE